MKGAMDTWLCCGVPWGVVSGALKASVVAGQLDDLDDLARAETQLRLRAFSDRLDTVGGEQKVAPPLALPLAA